MKKEIQENPLEHKEEVAGMKAEGLKKAGKATCKGTSRKFSPSS